MSALRRRWLLALALAGALAATGWVASQDQADDPAAPQAAANKDRGARRAPVAAAGAPTKAKTAAETTPDLRLELLQRAAHETATASLFPSRNWQPPPPKAAAKPLLPSAPTAPPLPFTAFGRMVEDGRATVFLSGADRSYAVKVGDVINKAYRVDTISDGAVVLTYLPLNQQQTLRTGTH